jgi:hypothetical protein
MYEMSPECKMHSENQTTDLSRQTASTPRPMPPSASGTDRFMLMVAWLVGSVKRSGSSVEMAHPILTVFC